MTAFVCNNLCAVYNTSTFQRKFHILRGFYGIFMIPKFPTSWLSSDLKLKEHMSDLSINLGLLMVSMFVGICLIDLLTLCDGEISVLRRDTTLHYTVSHY